ncbi:hypothetical protein [Flavobacterium polysaccharolyticum]|uniref:Lipoprotein n=1 Tax=Flavobacterium polysaccharolyticum TaxID=3133148 RepID=A0ABU9NKJ0_9FLAO
MRKTILLLFLVILQGCNNLTMVDVYRENLSDEADGSISEMVKAKGGNATLKIYKDGKFKSVGVNAEIFYLVKIGDGFIKKKNSNKCLVKRNDSLICLDCYTLSKEIKDSLGSVEEWSNEEKGFWFKKYK